MTSKKGRTPVHMWEVQQTAEQRPETTCRPFPDRHANRQPLPTTPTPQTKKGAPKDALSSFHSYSTYDDASDATPS